MTGQPGVLANRQPGNDNSIFSKKQKKTFLKFNYSALTSTAGQDDRDDVDLDEDGLLPKFTGDDRCKCHISDQRKYPSSGEKKKRNGTC